jgi:DNA-binding transcriptional regulator YdaS (Cro superfamily)
MKLISFLKSIPVVERQAFAFRCETSWGYLLQVAYEKKNCGEKLAINIERESDRQVRCEELCPKTDWAFIRGSGAQKEPEQVSA